METTSAILESRLAAALAGFASVEAHVQPATDARFGDYQTNVAMVLAKQQRANPRQLAQQIIDRLNVGEMCEPLEIAGAGFINFRLKPAWLAERFAQFGNDPRLGVPPPVRVKKVVIDFSSPNVAKPMHVGHIRSTILGDALARIASFVGHDVVRDNHIGDWGTQFGKVIYGWKNFRDEAALAADPVEELVRLYREAISKVYHTEDWLLDRWKALKKGREDGSIKPQDFDTSCASIASQFPEHIPPGWPDEPPKQPINDEFRRELSKLQNGDSENRAIWQRCVDLTRVEMENIYGRLGVKFDVTLGESFYNPQLAGVLQQLRDLGIARESEGALCVFSDEKSKPEDDPFFVKEKDGWRTMPALVQKADGAANYTTTDLATLEYRLKTWAPDEIVYVTDGRQQLHFRQLFAIFRRWHPEAEVRLAHAWFGSILGDDGKPFKTRSGETIKLADLLDEAEERALKLVTEKNADLPEAERREIARIVGLGAVKYADLLPNRQSDYLFSWDKMLSLQGNTAPYLQYSYVRIRSIFRKAEETGVRGQESGIRLMEPAEISLAKKLLQFGEVLPQILDDFRPNLLANYLYELASIFHGFFESCPVLKSEGVTLTSRLALCEATARVLQQGLGLLGIEVPERM